MAPAFRVFRLAELPAAELPGGRGAQKPIVDAGCGATVLDVHLNLLDAREPEGRSGQIQERGGRCQALPSRRRRQRCERRSYRSGAPQLEACSRLSLSSEDKRAISAPLFRSASRSS